MRNVKNDQLNYIINLFLKYEHLENRINEIENLLENFDNKDLQLSLSYHVPGMPQKYMALYPHNLDKSNLILMRYNLKTQFEKLESELLEKGTEFYKDFPGGDS